MAAPSYSSTIRSVPWNAWNALFVFVVPWVILPIALIIFLHYAFPYVPAVQWFLRGIDSNDPAAAFIMVLVDAVGSLGAIGYFLRKHRVGLGSLGLNRFSLGRALLLLLLVAVSFGLLVTVAYYLVQLIDPSFNPDQTQTNEFTGIQSNFSLWALVIIPPFVEEPVFRGFMFSAFSKRYGVVFGAICSSILFGFAHLQANVSVYTFVLGLLLCWLYVRLGSIIPGIGLHMLNNYLAYTAMNQK